MLKKLFGLFEKKVESAEVEWFSAEKKPPNNDRKVRIGIVNGNVSYASTGYYFGNEWFCLSTGKMDSFGVDVVSWRELIETNN